MTRNILTITFLLASLTVAVSQQYFFVFLNTNYDREELPKSQVDSLQNAHMQNIIRLANLKKLIAAGPFNGGGGIFIFKVSSEKEVRDLLKTDPAISANRFRLEVFAYTPIKGGICPVKNDAEMTTHSFIRIEPAFSTDSTSVGIVLKESQNNSHLVASAELGNGKCGILLFDDPAFKQDFNSVNGIKAGKIKYLLKELWIAKGSFCEVAK